MVVLLKYVLLTILLFSVETTLLIGVLSIKCLLLIKILKFGILSKMILRQPVTKRDGIRVPKCEIIMLNATKMYKAINLLYCNLNGDEFERISSYTSAHEIWNKIIVTYEGISQVKETKISIFLHKYEWFKMAPNESIKEMFTRFTLIVNNLHYLGKSFTNDEKFRKILRCLPKCKWG